MKTHVGAPVGKSPSSELGDSIELSFVYSVEHFGETLRRFRRQSVADRAWSWVRYVLAAAIIVFMHYLLSTSRFVLAFPLAVISVFLLFSQAFAIRRAKLAFLSSPYRDLRQSMRFGLEGVESNSEFEFSQASWQAFTQAVFFDDGFLLFRGGNLVHWLPYASLENLKDAQRLRELVSSSLPTSHAM